MRGIIVFVIGWTTLSLPAWGQVSAPVTDLVVTPNGTDVVACSQEGLVVYAADRLETRHTIPLELANPHCLAFSPSGSLLAIGGGDPAVSGSVVVVSWPDGAIVQTLRGHGDSVMDVVWLSEATMASASLDHHVHVWHLGEANPQRVLSGHSRGVTALACLDEQQLLISGGLDASIRVWNRETWQMERSLTIHTGPVTALEVKPAEAGLPMIASASRDRTIRFWQPTIGRMVRFAKTDRVPLDLAWSVDGTLLASCDDGSVLCIDPLSVQVQPEVPGDGAPCFALAEGPGGTITRRLLAD